MQTTKQLLKVGVLMGGKSIEREVSFNSGRTICDHLDSARYEIIPIFQQSTGKLYILPWRFLSRGKISDFEHRLATETKAITWDDLPTTVDFVYIALHGRYAEDGTLQGMLELLNVPYLGAKLLASAIGMDKVVQKKILAANGIDVPRGVVLLPHEINRIAENGLEGGTLLMRSYPSILRGASGVNSSTEKSRRTFTAEPVEASGRTESINGDSEFTMGPGRALVIKPHKEGSSLGMSVVKKVEDLPAALTAACNVHAGLPQSVLVEEKIEGMEFTCIILTKHDGSPLVLPLTEVVHEPNSDFYTYEQKYMPGRAQKFTPARCSAEDTQRIQEVCLRVMQLFEFTNMARIDGFLTADKRVIIIDPNTLTGMGPASFLFRQAAEVGMSHAQVINHLIETELAHAEA